MNHDDKETGGGLSFNEKMIRILTHWIAHNTDHAKTYEIWAERAKENALEEAGVLLEEASKMALLVNEKFAKAIQYVKDKDTID